MVSLSPGMKILADLRSRKALRLSSSLALDDYEDLESAVHSSLPPGVSRANPSDQVATAQDVLDYFRTAPKHEQKIAVMRIHAVPDAQIAQSLGMDPRVFKAVSNQMLAKFSAHRAEKVGGGLTVSPQQSTGVARREAVKGGAQRVSMANESPLSPGHAILAELRAKNGQ
jgi:hypothetical protein